jgi:hypothetical protein
VQNSANQSERTLIAGVGHRFWKDLSAGPVWIDELAKLDWPNSVDVQDFSFGAVAMMQNLQDIAYVKVIFLSAEPRDREPGSLDIYRYQSGDENPERVQEFIGEAGGGVVAIDPLLSIAGYFGVLPYHTWVIELEPNHIQWDDPDDDFLIEIFPRVVKRVRELLAGNFPVDAEVCRDA